MASALANAAPALLRVMSVTITCSLGIPSSSISIVIVLGVLLVVGSTILVIVIRKRDQVTQKPGQETTQPSKAKSVRNVSSSLLERPFRFFKSNGFAVEASGFSPRTLMRSMMQARISARNAGLPTRSSFLVISLVSVFVVRADLEEVVWHQEELHGTLSPASSNSAYRQTCSNPA